MELGKINVAKNEILDKRTPLKIIYQIGVTILLSGIMCYFIAEIIEATSYLTNLVKVAMIMTYVSDASGIAMIILFMIWVNVKESKKTKALKNATLGLLFYIFIYSFSLIFIPPFYMGIFEYQQPISYFFNSLYLNFSGLILNMGLSLGLFVYILITKKKTQSKNTQKTLLAFVLLIYGIINVTMFNLFRCEIFDYKFPPFHTLLEQTSTIFLPRIVELVLFLLIFFAILSSTILDNKRLEKLWREGLVILFSTSYLALSTINGIDFYYGGSYIEVSLGKILISVGAPITIIAAIIALAKQTKEPLKLITHEQVITEPSPIKEKTKTKKPKTKPQETPIIEEEEDGFIETEGYDELFETGLFHIQKGEFSRAIEYWERCVKAKPDFLPGWNNLGLAYKDLEELNKAITCWGKALEIDPNYTEAAHNLEVALLLKRKKRK